VTTCINSDCTNMRLHMMLVTSDVQLTDGHERPRRPNGHVRRDRFAETWEAVLLASERPCGYRSERAAHNAAHSLRTALWRPAWTPTASPHVYIAPMACSQQASKQAKGANWAKSASTALDCKAPMTDEEATQTGDGASRATPRAIHSPSRSRLLWQRPRFLLMSHDNRHHNRVNHKCHSQLRSISRMNDMYISIYNMYRRFHKRHTIISCPHSTCITNGKTQE
jgi:hypothetical protein